ncbi:MAG: hypothetical protein WKF92_06000 [Pyrinomonadaceae bacterium]
MNDQKLEIDKLIMEDWRSLGFYYDFDDRVSVNQWRFFGSSRGLRNLVHLIAEYAGNPENAAISEHEHLGPYFYLTILTWDAPTITKNHLAGTIHDLNNLSNIISKKLDTAKAGETFNIEREYGIDNTVTAKFFVMLDEFDAGSMDELIISGRQKFVNQS